MEYRHRLAIAKEKEDNIPAATHIKNLTQQENTRTLFRQISYLEKKTANLSTSRVTISAEHGGYREVMKKAEIEKSILRSNERKFHQTEGHGQLQTGQLLKDLGIMGTGPKSVQVQLGTYTIPRGLSNATKQFITCLKRPEGYKVIPPITYQEFCDGWTKAKECTSSHGPHFGHYKAALHHHHISHLLYQRALIPMLTGYSPNRHREGIDVMLLKKENDNNVDRLRTIVLFDSEANMNYKHLGRRAMKSAIELNQIVPEQYSRPNRNSIDHALNRQLVMDHQMYTRTPYALVSVDLKSCYDRINHTSASLALQRIGIHTAEIVSMFDSIQRMVHKVRTAFGDSKGQYGGNILTNKWKLPPQGVLQGNGCGPAIWSILSSCIFQLLHKQGHQNTFTSAIRHSTFKLAGFAYVDDTDLLQVAHTVEEVVQYMQKKLDDWNDNVGVTGGILSPSKCWWYLITFEFIRGRWKACTPHNRNFQLWIKDECKRQVSLQQLDPSVGMNMLGVKLAPDGNRSDHIAMLRDKATQWASRMRGSNANAEEVWTALHRTIPFGLCYLLPAVPLTREECKRIFAPVVKVGLPLTGIVATIPVAIRSSTVDMGGLGVIDPYLHMGISQIITLVSQRWKQSPTGQLLDTVLDDLALEMGLSPPWQTDNLSTGLQYTTKQTWIHNTEPTFHPNCDGDITIMDLALASTTKCSTLRAINRVRMSLKVIWLSDIASADGRTIDPRWLKHQPSYPRRNDFEWPIAHHTSPGDWQTWRRCLRTACRHRSTVLLTPLQPWQTRQADWLPYWDCFVTSTWEILYIRSDNRLGWRCHIKIPGRQQRHIRFHTEYLICNGPLERAKDLYRASIHTYRNYIEITALGPPPRHWTLDEVTRPPLWTPGYLTKETLLGKLSETLHPFYLESTDQLDILFQDFSNGSMLSVSDGSYFPRQNKAACAWLIESACQSQWILGSMSTPGGTYTDHSAYRSELAGLLAISVTIKLLSSSFHQPKHLIIGCDGQAALQTLHMTKNALTVSNKHADIQSMIIDIWSSVEISPYPVHILGHQDALTKHLTRLEKMNIMVDRLATLTADTTNPSSTPVRLPGFGLPIVRWHDTIIQGDWYRTLYEGITTDCLMKYYSHQIFSSQEVTQTVAYNAFKAAQKETPTGMNKFITKWISNTVATGVVLQRRNHRVFNRCPRCNEWGEDKLHVIVCWDIRAKVIWDKRVSSLKSLLLSLHTHPEIFQFIIQGLTTFRKHPKGSCRHNSQVQDWKVEQEDIGWLNFLTGFVGNKMIQRQQDHFTNIGRHMTGKTWASKIICHGWHTIFKLWVGRNEVLHKKESINALSGGLLLDIEIEKEYTLGCAQLPRSVHKWFQPSLDTILAQTVEYKKGWLLIVRSVKEALNIADYSIFESSQALRKWIGL